MSSLGRDIHVMAYFEELLNVMEKNRDMKNTTKLYAKRGVAVAGGAAAGMILFGPIGAVVGGAVAGTASSGIGSTYEDMLRFLREMDHKYKTKLVDQIEELLGNQDTDFIKVYVKRKEHREQLIHLIENFVIDEFGDPQSTTMRDDNEHRQDEYERLFSAAE